MSISDTSEFQKCNTEENSGAPLSRGTTVTGRMRMCRAMAEGLPGKPATSSRTSGVRLRGSAIVLETITDSAGILHESVSDVVRFGFQRDHWAACVKIRDEAGQITERKSNGGSQVWTKPDRGTRLQGMDLEES